MPSHPPDSVVSFPDGQPVRADDVPRVAEHLFRQEAGRLISMLTGIFGLERLQLAEDVVQEALMRALQVWPFQGLPDEPAAWLFQTARRLALDVIRREKTFRIKQPQIVTNVEQQLTELDARDPQFEAELRDARLRLVFACCHPALPEEAQVALALKTLGGFSTEEIAAAFLCSEPAMAKRLTRARQKIRDERIPFEIPAGPELAERLAGVLKVLYLLFNEGYRATSGERLIKEEICAEAIRLARLVADHPAMGQPAAHALLALMLFNEARRPARVDAQGQLVRLRDQDRARWDYNRIAEGLAQLALAAVGQEASDYHLQAGIAACHCTAADYASTDWARILCLYDQLLAHHDSPIYALNRAVAVGQVHGPAAGMEAVEMLIHRHELASYPLLYAVMGDFAVRLERFDVAADHLREALRLTTLPTEQAFLRQQLRELDQSEG
ncbi:MAG: RNA polymerase sigma-70 factor ECF subfamily [Puniceicoccaceae bacterium 5H]|nr:MAG: RNA polymerase sigma-70 factor ECF subfamily [Puniceicoccaceae bacterium 5H]